MDSINIKFEKNEAIASFNVSIDKVIFLCVALFLTGCNQSNIKNSKMDVRVAISTQNKEMLTKLIKEKKSLNYPRDSSGNSPLVLAMRVGNVDIINMMLKNGANTKSRNRARKGTELTPVDELFKFNSVSIIKKVLVNIDKDSYKDKLAHYIYFGFKSAADFKAGKYNNRYQTDDQKSEISHIVHRRESVSRFILEELVKDDEITESISLLCKSLGNNVSSTRHKKYFKEYYELFFKHLKVKEGSGIECGDTVIGNRSWIRIGTFRFVD